MENIFGLGKVKNQVNIKVDRIKIYLFLEGGGGGRVGFDFVCFYICLVFGFFQVRGIFYILYLSDEL